MKPYWHKGPWADRYGDPHLHACGCGHEWVAPLSEARLPCPKCTDDKGHNYLDRQRLRIAKSAVDEYGIDAVMNAT